MSNCCTFFRNETEFVNHACFAPLRDEVEGKGYVKIPKDNKANFSLDQIKEFFSYLKSDVFKISFKENGKHYEWEAIVDLSLPRVQKISTLMVLRYFWEEGGKYGKVKQDHLYGLPSIFMDIVKTTDIEPFEALQLIHYYLDGYINTNHTLVSYNPGNKIKYFYRIKSKKEILERKNESYVNPVWTGEIKTVFNEHKFFVYLENKEYKNALEMLK